MSGGKKPTMWKELLRFPAGEFDLEFVQMMANRMTISAEKYGSVQDATIDCIATARKAIDAFELDGNGEHLVDAGNYLMMAKILKQHPNYSFTATDSDGSIGRVGSDGVVSQRRNP